MPMRRLLRLRGVGNKTRREIAAAVRILRERLGSPSTSGTKDGPESEEAGLIPGPLDPALSIDLLAQRVLRVGTATATRPSRPPPCSAWTRQCLRLGPARRRSPGSEGHPCPRRPDRRQGRRSGGPRTRPSPCAGGRRRAAQRQRRDPTVDELGEAMLAGRGSGEEEPQRTRRARAVARAAVEVERTMAEPRFLVRRDDHRGPDRPRSRLAATPAARRPRPTSWPAKIRWPPLPGPWRDCVRSPPPSRVPHCRRPAAPAGGGGLGDAAVSSRQELYPRGMQAARRSSWPREPCSACRR